MAQKDFFEKREKELTEDLQVLEGYIKSFWEILPIPVCSTNPIFTILETGRTFDILFGYGKDELMGSFLDALFEREDDFKRFSTQFSQEKKLANFEVVLRTKKGKNLSVLISAIAREDEQGEVVGHLFSFVDVSLIKKTERELREKVEELEKVNKLMIGRELKMVELKEEIKKGKEK
ncbi:MAG: PAS domain-containing protein [Patescibacteria group bacterium]